MSVSFARALINSVLRRADHRVEEGEWRQRALPDACAGVPTMLIPDELRLLEYLTEDCYRGEGAIVDAGCFLGGSTLALASGLRKNLARRHRRETRRIHSFDLFLVEDWTRGIYFPPEVAAGTSTRQIFDRTIAPYAGLVEVHEGDITATRWQGGPIEILFIDVAKLWTTCDWITLNLFPHLIPGRSIVVQQDYLYSEWNGWIHVTMEYFADEFEMLCDTEFNSVAFRLVKPFAPGRIKPNLVAEMPTAEKIDLMDRAGARFTGAQAEMLRTAKAHFLEMLPVD
jgi:hypothetical protein